MTTIATNGRTMAADGLANCQGIIVGRQTRKISRLNDGSLLGICGGMSDIVGLRDWFNGGCENEYKPSYDDTEGLLLKPDGTLFLVSAEGRVTPAEAPAARGSGMAFALAAMACGHEPVSAVGIAAQFDVYTGGDLFVEALL